MKHLVRKCKTTHFRSYDIKHLLRERGKRGEEEEDGRGGDDPDDSQMLPLGVDPLLTRSRPCVQDVLLPRAANPCTGVLTD